jgi:hypothetical protein
VWLYSLLTSAPYKVNGKLHDPAVCSQENSSATRWIGGWTLRQGNLLPCENRGTSSPYRRRNNCAVPVVFDTHLLGCPEVDQLVICAECNSSSCWFAYLLLHTGDRPWGAPSFLYDRYRESFMVVKRPGRAVHQPPHLAQR